MRVHRACAGLRILYPDNHPVGRIHGRLDRFSFPAPARGPRPAVGVPITDKCDPRYWKAVKTGDSVSLTDFQSIAVSGSEGKDDRIGNTRDVVTRDKGSDTPLAEYRFLEIAAGRDNTLSRVVIIAAGELELFACYPAKGIPVATRYHLIDLDRTWFFHLPRHPEDFILFDLEYAPYPDLPRIEEEGVRVEREYGPGGYGHPVHGSCREGREEVPVIITEYASEDEQTLNPLMPVLEERWILPDGTIPAEGRFVVPLIGSVVHPDSAETDAA